MLYLSSSDGAVKIVILESCNIEEIKKGRPAVTQDKSVCIAWTPDPVWLADRLMDCGGDLQKATALIDEAATRPEKPAPRPYHKPHLTQYDREGS